MLPDIRFTLFAQSINPSGSESSLSNECSTHLFSVSAVDRHVCIQRSLVLFGLLERTINSGPNTNSVYYSFLCSWLDYRVALQKRTHTLDSAEVSFIMEVFDGLKWVHSGTQGQLFWCPARPPNWALCLSVPW